jgi:hypothetical protein
MCCPPEVLSFFGRDFRLRRENYPYPKRSRCSSGGELPWVGSESGSCAAEVTAYRISTSGTAWPSIWGLSASSSERGGTVTFRWEKDGRGPFTGGLDWLCEARRIEEGDVDRGLDLIMDIIDDAYHAGAFGWVNRELYMASETLHGTSTQLIVILLAVGSWAKDRMPAYRRLFEKARQVFLVREPDRIKGLLQGFKP